MRKLLLLLLTLPLFVRAQNGIITTFAGNGLSGYTGDGGSALFADITPMGIAIDDSNEIYFADNLNSVVRKINTSGVISTIVGSAGTGYSGDGGLAVLAKIGNPTDVAVDGLGNIYVADNGNFVVRKISSSGVITTIAGSGFNGYGGDGGLATLADLCPYYLATDSHGNIYISDISNSVVRKVNPSGIISTIAGVGGIPGFGGDGGPATSALLNSPAGINIDGHGNIFISDRGNFRIRKIDTTGIITTIAGNGVSGFSGDGGMATMARISSPAGIATDFAGNVFFADSNYNCIRKISSSGIITTVVGNTAGTFSGDGGPAKSASLDHPIAVKFDDEFNLYVSDAENHRIRKVSAYPYVSMDSFSIYLDNLCNGMQIGVLANSFSSSLREKTFYGDGSYDSNLLSNAGVGLEYASNIHSYSCPGTYTMKTVISNGISALDSAIWSYDYLLCSTFPLRFYYDANGNCAKDSSELFNSFPITIEVDSNGIAIDTISVTSGLDYIAYGVPGDVYSFRIFLSATGVFSSCLSGGIVTDTLKSGVNNEDIKYIGLSCISGAVFDLAAYINTVSGRHVFEGDAVINNAYCNPLDAIFTMDLSPKYSFRGAIPPPSSISGNTIAWNLTDVSANAPQFHIHFTCEVPGAWLIPGDTVHSDYTVNPTVGDSDPTNNNCIKIDTVKSSFDPNEMSVTPQGYITSGTQLQYTINFENTGNDTARNIYVMDTLSDNEIATSMRMVASSAVMNIIPIKAGGHNIIKFDFPNIKLLDSSHHNQCNGMLMFTINTRSGLPDGTLIPNHAGIFFDDNPVVMTDTVINTIGHPSLGVSSAPVMQAAIFPNPATDVLTIKADPGYYSSYTITNIVGAEVLGKPLHAAQTTIDIKTLMPGVYYVRLSGDGGSVVKKFVKM